MLAAIRPDEQSFALLLHLVGATIVFGAPARMRDLVCCSRAARPACYGSATSRFCLSGSPGWILMRLAGQWLFDQQNWSELPDQLDNPAWLEASGSSSQTGEACSSSSPSQSAAIGMRRLQTGNGSTALLKTTMAISLILTLAYAVAVWAMTGKPN